jgi:hypothetical protein
MESLFYKGFPYIATALPAVLGPVGLRVAMSGVLCHKHPRVRFDAPESGRTELGDLLIVARRSVRGVTMNRALLLQLKRLPGGAIEAQQRKLYTKWPGFHYDSTFASGAGRRVTPSRPHDGAQFAEVVFDAAARQTMSIDAVSATIPELRRPLADTLASVIAGTGGRQFVDRSQLTGGGLDADWDAVVWDLLDAAAHPSYTWGAGDSGRRRGWEQKRFLSFTMPTVPALLRQSPGASDAASLWEEASGIPDDPGPARMVPDQQAVPEAAAASLLHIDLADRQ